MTLEEAIKEIEQSNPDFGNFRKAVRLGLEALKRINYMRDLGSIEATEPLPSETEG